jgi:hypothetical protein
MFRPDRIIIRLIKIRKKRLVVYHLQLSIREVRYGFVSGISAVKTAR